MAEYGSSSSFYCYTSVGGRHGSTPHYFNSSRADSLLKLTAMSARFWPFYIINFTSAPSLIKFTKTSPPLLFRIAFTKAALSSVESFFVGKTLHQANSYRAERWSKDFAKSARFIPSSRINDGFAWSSSIMSFKTYAGFLALIFSINLWSALLNSYFIL